MRSRPCPPRKTTPTYSSRRRWRSRSASLRAGSAIVLPQASPLQAIGFAVAAIGVAIAISAVVQFRRARTSVRPDRPSTAILSTGPYRYSRNPIYLGMFVVVAGLAVALDSLWQFAALAVLYRVLRWGVVAREEAYLTRKFGDAYLDYARRVRRWI